MKMKVEIISRETIKPSFPTPPHLRSFKLSLFDQMCPLSYLPIVFFYPTEGSSEGIRTQTAAERSNQLKKSLSETLTRYYPLAGRIQDGSSIDCNDEGVDYLEAKVDCELSKVLKEPEIEVLNHFLPCDVVITEPDKDIIQLAIQVNNFDCGGVAIGMCLLHKIVDGSSLGAFVKDWASIARGSSDEPVCPIFVQDSLLPSRGFSGLEAVGVEVSEVGSITRTRRFVFNGPNITALKEKVINNKYSSSVKQPTRDDVVSTLLWQRIMAASIAKPDSSKKIFIASHTIDMRGKMIPPLPGNSIGNITSIGSVSSTIENKSEFGDLVDQLGEAISKVNDDSLRELQGEEGFSRMLEETKEWDRIHSTGEVDSYTFTSWCSFPLYEADFGWGKPTWVSSVSLAISGLANFIVLMDTRIGQGMEAWVTLDEKVMAVLERDEELLAFALSNPSTLD